MSGARNTYIKLYKYSKSTVDKKKKTATINATKQMANVCIL